MATINSSLISILTFNMHGFNQGYAYIKDMCNEQTHDIIFIQEHWLHPSTLHKIINISDNYIGFGKSAMESELENSMLKGRPFGGTAILINKKFENMHIESFVFDRIVAILLGDFLFINVYLPYNNGTVVHIDTLSEILANVSNVIDSIDVCNIVFGGDLNTDINHHSVHSNIILDFMKDYEIVPCKKQLFGSCDVQFMDTFISEPLNASSCIDFICVSSNICDNVSKYEVLDVYNNHSDHMPVVMRLCLPTNSNLYSFMNGQPRLAWSISKTNKPKVSHLRWDKGDIHLYQDLTCSQLYPIYNYLSQIDTDSLLINDNHNMLIDDLYANMVSTLHCCTKQAIPSVHSTVFKHWWSSELSDFKAKSLTSYTLWLNSGKPRVGEIYCNMRDDKLRYKLAIKHAKKEAEGMISDDLYKNLSQKNSTNFWKTWKSKIVHKIKGSVSVEGSNSDKETTSLFAKYFSSATSPNTPEYHNDKREEFHKTFLAYKNVNTKAKSQLRW